jgi:hypothetical protein
VREWKNIPLNEYERDIELESHFKKTKLEYLEDLLHNRICVYFPELALLGNIDNLLLLLRNQLLKQFLALEDKNFFDFALLQVNRLYPIEESIAKTVIDVIWNENQEIHDVIKLKNGPYYDAYLNLLNQKGMAMKNSEETLQSEVKTLIRALRRERVKDM